MRTYRSANWTRLLLTTLVLVLCACDVDQRFILDDTTDASDALVGDGVCAALVSYEFVGGVLQPVYRCTLRAAIEEANAGDGTTEIQVPVGISAPETWIDFAFDPIDVTGDVSIIGFPTFEYGLPRLHGTLNFLGGSRSWLRSLELSANATGCIVVGDAELRLVEVFLDLCDAPVGGAIFVGTEGVLHVDRSQITDADSSVGEGAAIYNLGRVTVRNSSFDGNDAAGLGGAVFNAQDAEISLANTSIHDSRRGGMRNEGIATLSNVSITENDSPGTPWSVGGLTNVYPGRTTIRNSMLAKNQDGDCIGSLDSEGYNLISHDTNGWCARTGESHLDTVNAPAQLSTRYEHLVPFASMPTEVARPYDGIEGNWGIGAGNPDVPGTTPTACEPTDLLGNLRVFAARCDIGAIQVTE